MDEEIYQNHATELVRDVLPKEDLKKLINLFMVDASINMGNDFTDNSLDRVVQIVDKNFRFLPVYAIASAFKKGSLGNYGAGRLVPRTIYNWLGEISIEYNRDQADKIQRENLNDVSIAMDLHKYPVGKAIIKKIDWLKYGAITPEEWDKISLKEVAEVIGRGETPIVSQFNLLLK